MSEGQGGPVVKSGCGACVSTDALMPKNPEEPGQMKT